MVKLVKRLLKKCLSSKQQQIEFRDCIKDLRIGGLETGQTDQPFEGQADEETEEQIDGETD